MQYTVQILVLLGQPAGEAESTARGPSQVEHEKSRTGERTIMASRIRKVQIFSFLLTSMLVCCCQLVNYCCCCC